MNTSFLFWLIVIFCVAAILFFWREPLFVSLRDIFDWDGARPTDEFGEDLEDLEIEINQEAFSEGLAQEEGEVLGEQTDQTEADRGYSISEIKRIDNEVKRISRQTQVIQLEVEKMQNEQQLEDIEAQLEGIGGQLEELAVQLEALESLEAPETT